MLFSKICFRQKKNAYTTYFYTFSDPPSEPTKLKVVDSTKTSVTLGWVKPVYDGGSEITYYVVEQMTADEKEWVTISSKGEVRTTEYVVSHLKPGLYYYFRVSAVNCVGVGRPIEMIQPVQAKDILGLCCFFLCRKNNCH